MQSMLWLQHILIVIQISKQINFVLSESNHPGISFKWWRKHHNNNVHKHLIEEMSPGQFSHFQEEYNDNKIPLRHEKFAKLDQIMCSRMGNCGVSPTKKDAASKELNAASVLQLNRDMDIEMRLRNIKKSKIDNEAPVVEDLNDFAAVQTNRSHSQENERRKQNGDDLSPVSKMKMEKAGNRSALDIRFQEIYKTSPPVSSKEEEKRRLARLADAHINQAIEETRCKTPTPIIIRISEIHRHPHKFYLPQCTKLFQCTGKSGCCTEPKRCMPHKTENVTLYFKVHTGTKGGGEIITVESLTFQNDTECRCKNMSTSDPIKVDRNLDSLDIEAQDESRFECICPAPYSKRLMNDGTCTCDCFYDDKQCLNHKTGASIMKLTERKCVAEERCTKPTCEYGEYLVKSGRCPKFALSKRQN